MFGYNLNEMITVIVCRDALSFLLLPRSSIQRLQLVNHAFQTCQLLAGCGLSKIIPALFSTEHNAVFFFFFSRLFWKHLPRNISKRKCQGNASQSQELVLCFPRSFSEALLTQGLLGRLAAENWALRPLLSLRLTATSQRGNKCRTAVIFTIF